MLSFTTSAGRFQIRAAAVIAINDHLLLHRAEQDSFWALPGGRIEMGEDAASTIRRELMEELEISAKTKRLMYVVENFFEYRNEHFHEVGLYFETELIGHASVIDAAQPFIGTESNDRLIFQWFPMKELRELDIRPSFLIQALSASDNGPSHWVHRDDTTHQLALSIKSTNLSR